MEGSVCPNDHKLCGHLCTLVSVPGSTPSLPFLTPCLVFSKPNQFGFRAQNDTESLLLLSVDNDDDEPNEPAKKKKKRRGRGMGTVNGSSSVVRQIHALVSHRCIKVVARVLHVDTRDGEESSRAVLLVDVYLPILVWSGWQFPKSRAVAGSFLSHLSCDWDRRSSMLAGEEKWFKDAQRDNGIWDLPDCHVLGCKLHRDVPDSSRRKRFELHEIFRSLPGMASRDRCVSLRLNPADGSCMPGIWDVTDDILVNILSLLGPIDLVRVSSTCCHLRYLAASVMPCMKLKLFPHQRAAVEWMLKRERSAEDFPHPLFQSLSTEDGFTLHVNIVSGEITTGVVPTVRDFCGGMFCDEPGLGKTITALSLILKTQGTMAEPPDGVQISFCTHNGDQRCGYYELSGDKWTRNSTILGERVMSQGSRRGRLSFDQSALVDDISFSSPKRARSEGFVMKMFGSYDSGPIRGCTPPSVPYSGPDMRLVRCTRGLSHIKKNLLQAYEEKHVLDKGKAREKLSKQKRHLNHATNTSGEQHSSTGQTTPHVSLHEETWVQCDACRKWRKLNGTVPDASAAWFCSMNTDTSRQSCRDPEEASDRCQLITHLPGFCSKGTPGGNGENITFFISVLKDHHSLINWKTKKALTWLATLSHDRLSEMETIGLVSPFLGICSSSRDAEFHEFHIIFYAFGFIRRVEKGISRWRYPQNLDNLVFDLAAFRAALCEPLDSVRMYLSKATLIVVPANLVDHWKTQIQKHVKPCQLRLCIWTDQKKPSAHSLAWDFDVVITTFSRLSAEWGAHKKSPLMNVHWLRVMLDEGHTLGSSLTLTNKLQMAISLMATSRWLLTGTPMPYAPDTQLSQLQPMLKFLHEEVYGWNLKSWDAGILRPFEAQMEEGCLRLLQLLDRCLISARKEDLKTIPPCIKKVKFLDFTEEHARSYNELVVTVRRNILMADWNDPSHVESLLNPKQWKFRSATVKNVRLSCCVAGHIKVAEVGADIQETMDILVEKGLDPISEEYALIKYSLQYGNNCLRCKEWCRLPVVTPCRHILCIDCVALDSERCTFPSCDFLYEMQTPEKLTRPENPNPQWPVPKDLIELQPSYKQNDWDPDWLSTSSSKVAYLVQRLKELREASCDSIYSNNCDVMVTNNIENPSSTSQTTGSSILQSGGLASISNETGTEKVIIFSQFLEHINVIEEQLTFAGIKFAGCYSPLHASKKMKALETFQHDPNCMALLMDGSTALGLDLSFATHVFLMEPIWDGSMEQQVISRAHRMGATRPIHVETLVMRGTIEEQMVKFLQDADEHGSILKREFDKSEREWVRSHRSVHDFAESNYLAQLGFVRTSPAMLKMTGSKENDLNSVRRGCSKTPMLIPDLYAHLKDA